MIAPPLAETPVEEDRDADSAGPAVRPRLDRLKALSAGWLDGKGHPLPPHGLAWLADAFDSFYPSNARLPFLFPTPAGRVLAEWHLPPWAPSLDIDLETRRANWHALNLDTDDEAERTLDLSNTADWVWLAGQVRAFGGVAE